MKIAIVVGHNSKSRGAVRVTDGVTEFDWNSDLAEMIRQCDPEAVKIFYRDPKLSSSYSRQIDKVYAETDAWGADVTMELHFNGSVDPSAKGSLVLSSGTTNSMRLAELLRDNLYGVMMIEDDGVGKRGRKDRGGRSLWQGRAPAVLGEPFFGSRAESCVIADLHKEEIAEAYYRAARDFINGGKPAKIHKVPVPSVLDDPIPLDEEPFILGGGTGSVKSSAEIVLGQISLLISEYHEGK